MSQPLQVARRDLVPPHGQDFFSRPQKEGDDPVFSMREVSYFFFARTRQWLFRHISAGHHVLDGVILEVPYYKNKWQFQLYHIERMAHAFFGSGIISVSEFENALLIVKSIASNYRLI